MHGPHDGLQGAEQRQAAEQLREEQHVGQQRLKQGSLLAHRSSGTQLGASSSGAGVVGLLLLLCGTASGRT
eukprot:CAMPEP_0180157196 /NCGR_PEP_ID=MMETSP0986-20121125/26075_1 /TAXON_ID=697907 /ORGANISM="non described non described, Strain CCMP2293" /LENGTH=70 /DNA_ID=CAMNT_0022106625 /DNA_START=134 /DNA_END=343 /DNA_ORIENTATION=+